VRLFGGKLTTMINEKLVEIYDLEKSIELLQKEIKPIQEQIKQLQEQKEKALLFVDDHMKQNSIEKTIQNGFSISYRKSVRTVVCDEKLLPESAFRKSLDLVKIKELINKGEILEEAAKLEIHQNLQISKIA